MDYEGSSFFLSGNDHLRKKLLNMSHVEIKDSMGFGIISKTDDFLVNDQVFDLYPVKNTCYDTLP